MKYKIKKAIEIAKNAHHGQYRKYIKCDYFVHCEHVFNLVSQVTDDEDMLCAALLHDVVEDTNYTIDDIGDYFGFEVAKLVDGLTDISERTDGNRSKRKEIDRNHIARGCEKVKTIKLADLIDNSEDIIINDPKFAKVYIAEKKLLLDVLTEGNKKLYNRAKEIIDNYYKKGDKNE